jgi:hypothetical protein
LDLLVRGAEQFEKLGVRHTNRLCVSLRLFDHLGGEIDADHLAARSDPTGGEDAVEARTAAEVHRPMARTNATVMPSIG